MENIRVFFNRCMLSQENGDSENWNTELNQVIDVAGKSADAAWCDDDMTTNTCKNMGGYRISSGFIGI